MTKHLLPDKPLPFVAHEHINKEFPELLIKTYCLRIILFSSLSFIKCVRAKLSQLSCSAEYTKKFT